MCMRQALAKDLMYLKLLILVCLKHTTAESLTEIKLYDFSKYIVFCIGQVHFFFQTKDGKYLVNFIYTFAEKKRKR